METAVMHVNNFNRNVKKREAEFINILWIDR